jgi:hypothetical protein
MPTIMVVANAAEGDDAAVVLAERLLTVQLDDAHFAAQLVERLKWAAEDAEHAEREAVISEPQDGSSAVTPVGRQTADRNVYTADGPA